MYESYWRLERSPFDNDADAQFFYASETHQAALLKLRYLVENRKGAGLLLGGSGAGKTFLVQVLFQQLAETHGPFVHLVFPQLSPGELLAYLAVELGADPQQIDADGLRLDRTLREIESLLVRYTDQGRQPVIVVDEAHLIDDMQVFQALRLLLNIQQQRRADFSLILAGQQELVIKVRRLAQLDERIAVRCLLRPLSHEETSAYVTVRLQAAGCAKGMFHPQAIHALFELSGGIPRRINRMCDLALLVGFADDVTQITAEQIEAVADEIEAVAAE